MKKISCLAIFLFLFSSCSKEEYCYVKDVYINKIEDIYTVSLYCFDFNTGEGTTEKIYEENDLEAITVVMSEHCNINFRLCENVFLNPNCVEDFNKIFRFINSNKVPITTNLLFSEKYLNDINLKESFKTPIYNFDEKNNKYSGFVSIADNEGQGNSAVLFLNGIPVKILDSNHWNVLSLITGKSNLIDYSFSDNKYYSKLKCVHKGYYIENDILNIELDLILKSYKGMINNSSNKVWFIKLLKTELSNDITKLYTDSFINEVYNLDWYSIQQNKNFDIVKININVT